MKQPAKSYIGPQAFLLFVRINPLRNLRLGLQGQFSGVFNRYFRITPQNNPLIAPMHTLADEKGNAASGCDVGRQSLFPHIPNIQASGFGRLKALKLFLGEGNILCCHCLVPHWCRIIGENGHRLMIVSKSEYIDKSLFCKHKNMIVKRHKYSDRVAHNLKAAGSNPAPATNIINDLAEMFALFVFGGAALVPQRDDKVPIRSIPTFSGEIHPNLCGFQTEADNPLKTRRIMLESKARLKSSSEAYFL